MEKDLKGKKEECEHDLYPSSVTDDNEFVIYTCANCYELFWSRCNKIESV